MEYYSQYNTGKTDEIIKHHQQIIDNLYKGGELDKIDDYLMSLAADTAEKNVNKDGKATPDFNNIEGGPFAAVIVKKDGDRPVIIGVGANHVVPENDLLLMVKCRQYVTPPQGWVILIYQVPHFTHLANAALNVFPPPSLQALQK